MKIRNDTLQTAANATVAKATVRVGSLCTSTVLYEANAANADD
jgi:hypothetical protein